ncbi:MAG: hypothetical protein PHS93_03145 [Candidatus Omnitrophica bacterium]|nr:hypothetical protein [Candidatus Omnitrophota bacterium]MDD5352147.1 hypothetical protein [Candidatus Omnitrophota bacterium]MDD5549745.1 hypothetical protein [Candidatus Omnitrophota bacterium]
MDKNRIKIIITLLLIVVLIFVWANSIKILRQKLGSKDKTLIAVSSSNPSEPGLEKANTGYPKKEYREDKNLEWTRCPFSGKQYNQEPIVEFKVSGIMWDEVTPQAIVNGRILSVGDIINGFVVEKIERQKVILSNGQKEIELKL